MNTVKSIAHAGLLGYETISPFLEPEDKSNFEQFLCEEELKIGVRTPSPSLPLDVWSDHLLPAAASLKFSPLQVRQLLQNGIERGMSIQLSPRHLSSLSEILSHDKLRYNDLLQQLFLWNVPLRGLAFDPTVKDEDLTTLPSFSSLHSISLPAGHGISNKGISLLFSLSTLQSLEISFCQWTIAKLTSLTNLTALRLDRWDTLSSQTASSFSSLCNLESLDVSSNSNVSEYFLRSLKLCTKLKHLNLTHCKLHSFHSLSDLFDLHALQTLKLPSDLSLSKWFLYELFSYCIHLTQFSLPSPQTLETEGFFSFSLLREIEVLHTPVCKNINNTCLGYLKELTTLHTLNLSSCDQITDLGLPILTYLTALKSLSLRNCSVTYKALFTVQKITSLEHLSVHGCKDLTDSRLKPLSSLLQLRTIDLSSTDIYGSGLIHLRSPFLTRMSVASCKNLTDSGLEYLPPQLGLTHINISCCSISSDGIESLRPFSTLTYINADQCEGIDRRAVAVWRSFPWLKYLGLNYCVKISSEDLKHLQGVEISKMLYSSPQSIPLKMGSNESPFLLDLSRSIY